MYPADEEKLWIYGFRANEISKTAYLGGKGSAALDQEDSKL
jgi:hypothetical protein